MTAAAASERSGSGRRFVRVLGGLTALHLAVNLLTLVTGPLQARLLGPHGRGELALILVVTGFAALILSLGLGAFLAREIATSPRRGVLLGTVLLVSLGLGTVGALLAWPVSSLFADGGDVQLMLVVGLLLMPAGVAGLNLMGAYQGDEEWRRWSAMRLLVPLLTAIFYVVLAVAGWFTVVTAAATTFVATNLALLPLARLLRATRGWGFDRSIATRALAFGSKYSLSALASQGNVRIDQLLIAGLAGTRALGLYVVAFSLAAAVSVLTQALNVMVLPMVARGDHGAIRRILRVTLAVTILAAGCVAVAADPVVRVLFGAEFADSAVLTRVLCVAAVCTTGKGIATAALVGHGRPGEVAIVEAASLVVLVPALLVALPVAGAVGAAVVVSTISAVGLGVLVARTRKWLGGRLLEYLVPTAGDARWLRSLIELRLSSRG